jgi:FKBP-type peptidyl-prolyl cis-trans isomerase 2
MDFPPNFDPQYLLESGNSWFILPSIEEDGKTHHPRHRYALAFGVDLNVRQCVEFRDVPEEYREVGTAILMENDRGETRSFLVTRKDRKTITIDGNNPLCGREVIFKLEILLVRDASEEEIAAGGKVEEGPDIESRPGIHEVLN